jgi:hypothetical protein
MTYETHCALADEGLAAFWQVIAKRFPEATTGDLFIDRDIALTMAAIAAVAEWIDNNVNPPVGLAE